MLNKEELYRGLADTFIKSALLGEPLFNAGLNMLPGGIGMLSGGVKGLSHLGGNALGWLGDHGLRGANNDDPNSVGGAFRQGFNEKFLGSQGQIDEGNKVLGSATGGSLQLDPNNKAQINWGNAINHFGGQAMDWIKSNPGTAALGGGALLGGGMLLHSALGGDNKPAQQPNPAEPTPVGQPGMQRSAQRFAFDKPGISG